MAALSQFLMGATWQYWVSSPQCLAVNPSPRPGAIAWSSSGEELLIVEAYLGKAMLFNPDTGAMTPIGQMDGGLYAGDWSSAGQIAVGGVRQIWRPSDPSIWKRVD
jgi:hypothetical protein